MRRESRHTRAVTDADQSHEEFRGALQLIAEGVTELVGFGLAAVSVVRRVPGAPDELEVIAVAGHESGPVIVGRRTELASVLRELEHAEDWGYFKFLPHEKVNADVAAAGWFVPDVEPLDVPDAWHPLDLLLAPLRDEEGVLRGTLALDLPADGRRPDERQRSILERYAEQAARAVISALEREALLEQVRLAEAAREIVRNASNQDGLARVIADCQVGLAEGFRSVGSWIQTFDPEGLGTGATYSSDGAAVELPTDLVLIADRAARQAWRTQHTMVVSATRPVPEEVTPEENGTILAFLDAIGISSMLFVPIGAGSECLGCLALTRPPDAPEWTEVEQSSALDIGHDLGRVILNARTFEREHELVEELQELDTYKSQLIATVSHELKNPLTAILGYLEMLEVSPEVSGTVRAAVNSMERGARRLSRVIEDLLLLSKVGDPNTPMLSRPVELDRVVDEVIDLLKVNAAARDLTFDVDASGDLRAIGDADELDRVVANLVSNAVKYSPDGGVIRIGLARQDGRILLSVADEGLGISEEDQARLFDEFFRSSNPRAFEQPGTGLGLAIVQRIVERHGGQIRVDSRLGHGSTFTVVLPAVR